MHVSAHSVRTLAESCAHLGGRVGGVELHIPPRLDLLAQKVERKVLIAQALPYPDDLANAGLPVVNPVILSVLDQSRDEGRHAHDAVGLNALNGVPLQFGDAVAHADDGRTQLPQAEEIGQSSHEAFVEGDHQLEDVAGFQSGAFETLFLVVSQPLQILLGAAERHGIAERSAGGDVVDHLLLGHTEEILVEKLEILLFREGNVHKVLNRADFLHVDAVALEHALIKTGILPQIEQCLLKFCLLELFDFLRRGEFYVFAIIHRIKSEIKKGAKIIKMR